MSLYSEFAFVYDRFMADAPYRDWMQWLHDAEQAEMIPPLASLRIADVGCGTGILTAMLAARCRDIVGVDVSEEMLAEAAARAKTEHAFVRWLCQDVRTLRLPSTVDMVVSTCDCLNYLLTEEDWQRALFQIGNYLQSGGWFCFDVLGQRRVESLVGGLWHDIRDDAVVLFETQVAKDGLISYDVHAFLAESKSDGLYARIEEQHEQRYVAVDSVRSWLEQAGFIIQTCLGDFGRSSIDGAERVMFVTQKI